MSKTQSLVVLQERLRRKYPSMSEAALRSAVQAASTTLETGRGAAPTTPDRLASLTGDRNAKRAADARKGRRKR
jgi:hypothetical protein